MVQGSSAIDKPIGLYGGTFDPVHRGHVHAARTVQDRLGLSEIHMVLSARPGHRGSPGSSVDHRWQMLRLACQAYPGLLPDDSEVCREGKSYTYDTVRDFCAKGYTPCWIVGQDSYATLSDWYRWREILQYCNLVVLERPGDERRVPEDVLALEEECAVTDFAPDQLGQIWHMSEPMLEVSATEVRSRVAAGEDASDLLEDAVWTYIRQHNLYVEASV